MIHLYKIYIVLILLVVSSCSSSTSNDARHARTYEVRHPISIEEKSNSLEVPIYTDGSDFTLSEEAKIKSFLYEFNNQGNGNLVITVPESGQKAGPARQAVKRIIEIAGDVGLSIDEIRVGTYRPLTDNIGGVRLNFESLKASVQECSNNWNKNLTDASHNDLSKSHGCSTRRNLAAMIARPEDLVSVSALTPGNAARRVDGIDKYILGQSTSASRDSSETATATAQ